MVNPFEKSKEIIIMKIRIMVTFTSREGVSIEERHKTGEGELWTLLFYYLIWSHGFQFWYFFKLHMFYTLF